MLATVSHSVSMTEETTSRAYFVPVKADVFRPTEHAGGAWHVDEQHIAPIMGLLTHLVETDRNERGRGDLVVSRLSFDILGRLTMEEFTTRVHVLRPGRGVELVEAVATQNGRDAVLLRAWLVLPGETGAVAGDALPRIPPPEDMPEWEPGSIWAGGFIAVAEVRRCEDEPGRGRFWVRTPVDLLDGVSCSRQASTVGLLDIANGMAPRAHPDLVTFPNVDMTAHMFRAPEGEWIGFDTTVGFGTGGVGLTGSVLHDRIGPFGTLAQSLVVRPR